MQLAELFALRTDLLMGLGALKRAVLDISAALFLVQKAFHKKERQNRLIYIYSSEELQNLDMT